MTIPDDAPGRREPIFNMPGVVVGSIAVLALMHAFRAFSSPEIDLWTVLAFAFIPARYTDPEAALLPGGDAADVWTFLSYSLLHGDVVHLLVNLVWLAAFGSALAWRFGTWRFLAFSAACSVGGALAHLAGHWGEPIPMVGASAAISGHMAAVARYAFRSGFRPLGARGPEMFRRPAEPLADVLRDPRAFAFLAVWFGLNLVFGTGAVQLGADDVSIAWQAHIGGFLAGLVLFPMFDPIPRQRRRPMAPAAFQRPEPGDEEPPATP